MGDLIATVEGGPLGCMVLLVLGSGQHLTDPVSPEESPAFFFIVFLNHVSFVGFVRAVQVIVNTGRMLILLIVTTGGQCNSRCVRSDAGQHLLDAFPETQIS